MEKKAKAIRAMFSAISPRYDFLNHLLSLNIDRRWRRIAARESTTPPPKRVLDLCAGTGDLGAAYLKTMPENGLVVGADFSRPMLLRASEKSLRDSTQNQTAFTECDALRLPFPDNAFDVVASAFGLRNIIDWPKGLAEMTRVVRPGGKVAILEFSVPRRGPIRWLYLLYFLHILPKIGNRVSYSEAYSYFSDSVLNWPTPDRLSEMMQEAGLKKTRYRRLTFGIACLHIGILRE